MAQLSYATRDAGEGCLVAVTDFPTGSQDHFSETSWDGSKWCCTCLEENQVLLFEGLPYEFPEEDRLFLISHRLGEARFHKNISYRPEQDVVRGFTSADPETSRRMHEVMRRYSENVVQFLSRILAPYAGHWKLDYASFRPEAEQDRKLPLHKRNDLLHTDAFPSRPTRGGRILRCFTNLNPAEARIWQTTDPFPVLAMNHAAGAGLTDFARNGNSIFSTAIRGIKTAIGLGPKAQSRYDRFMLRFHDYLKENSDFQRNCRKVSLEFPPGSTWICFTDSVPHAVLRGQYAVEQTLIVPPEALIAPERSPLRILEKLAGAPLVP